MTAEYLEDFRETEDLAEYDVPDCSLCGGVLARLGKLGNLPWFRCTRCGVECSRKKVVR